MASTNSSWIAVAGLGLLTGLAGGFLGALLLVDRGGSPGQPASSPTNDESVAVLRDLAGEVRRLREAVEVGASSRPTESGSERAPMEPPPTERLERAIESLAEVLASPGPALSRPMAGAPPRGNTVPPKSTDRLLALRQARDPRPYFFWSVDQVVDQFGTPDWMTVAGGGTLRLQYSLSSSEVLAFLFNNGSLYSIEYPQN